MKVSVIICTYNRFEALKNAVKSIIDQSFKDWELIIVEGGNDDNTHRMLMSMYDQNSIKYIINSNDNRIAGRNKAISIAEGEYICFLDDDDICIQNRLENQVEYLDTHPEIDIVSTTTLFDNRSGLMHTLKNMNHEDITELMNELDIDHLCNFQSCMFRRSTIERIFDKGKYFYNEFIDGGEGQAFLYTLYFNGCKFANINNTIYIYNLCKAKNSLSLNVEPKYYNETLLEKDMTQKKNIITELYNKLKGLFIKEELKEEVQVVEKTKRTRKKKEEVQVVEETPVVEKTKRTRKKKEEVQIVEETPAIEKPKRGRKKKSE